MSKLNVAGTVYYLRMRSASTRFILISKLDMYS